MGNTVPSTSTHRTVGTYSITYISTIILVNIMSNIRRMNVFVKVSFSVIERIDISVFNFIFKLLEGWQYSSISSEYLNLHSVSVLHFMKPKKQQYTYSNLNFNCNLKLVITELLLLQVAWRPTKQRAALNNCKTKKYGV